MNGLAYRTSGANKALGYIVGVIVKVYDDVLARCLVGYLEAVAVGNVREELDLCQGAVDGGCVNRSLDSLVLRCADSADILAGSELADTFTGRNPLVVGRCVLLEGVALLHKRLIGCSSHGRLSTCIEDYRTGHRSGLQHQAEPFLGIISRSGNLHVAVDHALALYGNAHRRIAAVAAYVEGKVSSTSLCLDGAVVDHDIAVVVGQCINLAANQTAAVKSHALKRQVAVVLDKHICRVCGQRTVLQRHRVVLVKVNGLAYRTSGANIALGDIVGVIVKVNDDVLARCLVGYLEAVAV